MENEMIKRIITAEVKDVGDRTLEFTGSDETQDRMDEVIRSDGWTLKNFKKNPVFQWAHNYSLPPIGKAKRVWIDKEDKSLKFHIQFVESDVDYPANMPSPELVYQLYKGGFMRAVSVGFVAMETERGDGADEDWDKTPKKPRLIFLKQDLLELSAVPVPANPNALVDAQSEGVITAKQAKQVTDWIHKSEVEGALNELGNGGKIEPVKNEVITGKPLSIENLEAAQAQIDEANGKEPAETLTDAIARVEEEIAEDSPESKDDHKANPLSQKEIADELDYVKECISLFGMNEDTKAAAWNLLREIMRLTGDDIPDDICELTGAKIIIDSWDLLDSIQRTVETIREKATVFIPNKAEDEKPLPNKEAWTEKDSQEVIDMALNKVTGKL